MNEKEYVILEGRYTPTNFTTNFTQHVTIDEAARMIADPLYLKSICPNRAGFSEFCPMKVYVKTNSQILLHWVHGNYPTPDKFSTSFRQLFDKWSENKITVTMAD